MTPLIATHALAALTSLLVGGWQLFFSTKGSEAHRIVGRVWVAAMYYVAVTSFWIQELRPGHLSALHILSTVTIITVPIGLVSAMRGNIASHRGNMTGNWIGLCFAFVFAVAIPERRIPQFVVTEPAGALAAGLTVIVTSVALVRIGIACQTAKHGEATRGLQPL
jgi:uncharacterized membrane protein